MDIARPDDPRAFLDRAHSLLALDAEAEARHNLMLGIAATAESNPTLYPQFHAWIVLADDVPVAAATRTPPFNLVLADPIEEDALESLLRAVHEDDPETPGVVANVPHVAAAVATWERLTGAHAELVLAQGVYALTAAREVPPAPGAARSASAEDRHLLLGWLLAFAEEALPGSAHDRSITSVLEARLDPSDTSGLWLWEDEGRPVSLAGFGGPTPSGIRIGPVYTPPTLRRRGYATALVAELSRWLLGRGHRACFLYTDLANPTSNSIYSRIGYERIADAAEYRFDPA